MRGKKTKTPWLTRNQCEVLDRIAKTGRQGIKVWYTDINLATIRSLCKKGLADTASKGRILATRAGKRRLRQPWPPESAQTDRKGATASGESNVVGIEAQGEVGEA